MQGWDYDASLSQVLRSIIEWAFPHWIVTRYYCAKVFGVSYIALSQSDAVVIFVVVAQAFIGVYNCFASDGSFLVVV